VGIQDPVPWEYKISSFQDILSKFLVACPIQKRDAETIAKEFVTHIILKMGTPKTVLTDQGTNLSEMFKNVWKMIKIKKLQPTPIHPESNGSSLERRQSIEGISRTLHYIRDQSNWDAWVPPAVYVYHTSTHVATGYTPFELVYGFKSELPSNLRGDPNPQYN
jgi:hypothetical protein